MDNHNSGFPQALIDLFERERLHRAAEEGDLQAVQELLGRGDPVNAFDELGKTPLHYAVLAENIPVVEFLLRRGADINARDERVIGNTPLAEAAGTCSLAMAMRLVAAGADPTIRGWMRRNAVDRAQRRKKQEGIGGVGQAVYEFLREAARKFLREARRKGKKR
jgi:ankyrin repeat protein